MSKPFNLLFLTILVFFYGCTSEPKVNGLYWELKSTYYSPNNDTIETYQKHSLAPDKYKVETIGPHGEFFTIVRLDSKIVIQGSTNDSTYQELPFSYVDKRLELQRENIRRMRAQMDTMPQNLRSRMEMDLGVRWKPEEFSIIETDEITKISGLTCRKFIVNESDTLDSEYWITNDLGNYSNYTNDWFLIISKISSIQALEKLKLVYQKGIIIKSQRKVTTSLVNKITKKMIPLSVFEAPSGFTKVPPPRR